MKLDTDARLRALLEELGELLFEKADTSQMQDLAGIERELRRLGQEHLFPPLAAFFVERVAGAPAGRLRRLNTVLGQWSLSQRQLHRLQVKSHRQVSPLLENCLLVAAAKTSFAQAEKDLVLLCGVTVSDSTIRRLVLERESCSTPVPAAATAAATAAVSLVCVDGGMVRLEGECGGTQWRQYKAVSLEGGAEMVAVLGAEEKLAQHLEGRCGSGVVCIGDGHPSVWNTVAALPLPERVELLDWYHLKENLWKQPWSRERKEQVEKWLWTGHVDKAWQHSIVEAPAGSTLSGYLEKHWQRIPHGTTSYQKRQQQGLPIGSGSVESAIKQVDARLQLPGAWWNAENVNPMLDLRCAYLNGWLYN